MTGKRGPFIEPTRSTATVPSALQTLRVAKQGDGDYACGLFALITAARKLRATSAGAGATVLLAGLDAATRARVEARLPKVGLFESRRNDDCRARIDWEVDLTKLPVRKLSEESRAAFVSGNRFETTLPDAGKKVAFKLLTGDDERKLPVLQRSAPDKLLSAVLAYCVLEIGGVDAKAKRQFLEDLTMRDAARSPVVAQHRCGRTTRHFDRSTPAGLAAAGADAVRAHAADIAGALVSTRAAPVARPPRSG